MFEAPQASAAGNPRISIFLLYSGTVVDGYTSLMQRPALHRAFIHLPKGEAAHAAQAVNSQALHVLVDLNTHNRGGSTSVASHRPAQQILVYPDYPVGHVSPSVPPPLTEISTWTPTRDPFFLLFTRHSC